MSDKDIASVALEMEVALAQFLQFSPSVQPTQSAAAANCVSDWFRVFFAPGRVNLIGEHTDYNGGYVLPAALHLGTWLFVRERTDQKLRFASSSFLQTVEVPVQHLTYDADDDYANYPKGVIHEFQKLGFTVPGLDMFYYGNLPNGAGLSSSASIEVVTAWMLNEYLSAGLSRERVARLAQTAENQFVGVSCGIMDQFSVTLGQRNHAISLNCDTLAHELVPIQIADARFVIANTNKRRGLSDSKYNERRHQCEQALFSLQQAGLDVRNLGDVDVEDWNKFAPYLTDPTILRRARHVVFENDRAKRAVNVLQHGDITRFGQMMNESHVSLRDDYDVTGPELDALVEAAWSADGCIGSRMTGAGFGGCAVSLVQTDHLDSFVDHVTNHYSEKIGYPPSFYVIHIGDGVREVTQEVRT